MKCNVDGAYYPIDSSGEIGLVLRDHRGAFAGARARWQNHSLDALSMEAQAAKEGIEFALEKGDFGDGLPGISQVMGAGCLSTLADFSNLGGHSTTKPELRWVCLIV